MPQKMSLKNMSPGLVLLCVAEKENLWDKAGENRHAIETFQANMEKEYFILGFIKLESKKAMFDF